MGQFIAALLFFSAALAGFVNTLQLATIKANKKNET